MGLDCRQMKKRLSSWLTAIFSWRFKEPIALLLQTTIFHLSNLLINWLWENYPILGMWKNKIKRRHQTEMCQENFPTLFGFTKYQISCSRNPKQHKAVAQISSTVKPSTTIPKKPERIYYNSTERGVNETNKTYSIHSCSRRKRGWLMVVF